MISVELTQQWWSLSKNSLSHPLRHYCSSVVLIIFGYNEKRDEKCLTLRRYCVVRRVCVSSIVLTTWYTNETQQRYITTTAHPPKRITNELYKYICAILDGLSTKLAIKNEPFCATLSMHHRAITTTPKVNIMQNVKWHLNWVCLFRFFRKRHIIFIWQI